MTDLDLDAVLNDHTVYTTATDLRAHNVEDALDALLDAVPTLVAALREARAEVERLRLELDTTIGRADDMHESMVRQRDDWRRRYEALRDAVLKQIDRANAVWDGFIPTGNLREVVARVERGEA